MPRLKCLRIEEGRDLLRRILDEDLAQSDLSAEPLTSKREFVAFSNLQAEILPAHFKALQIIPFVNGWHWQLVLRGLPQGYPIGLRNFATAPLPTERHAFDVAKSATIRLFRIARGNALTRGARIGPRYFDLFGLPIPIPVEMLGQSATDAPPEGQVAQACREIQDLLPGPEVTAEAWNTLPVPTQREIQMQLASLMQGGRYRLADSDRPARRH